MKRNISKSKRRARAQELRLMLGSASKATIKTWRQLTTNDLYAAFTCARRDHPSRRN